MGKRITQQLKDFFAPGPNPHEKTDWHRYLDDLERNASSPATMQMQRTAQPIAAPPVQSVRPAARPVQNTEPVRMPAIRRTRLTNDKRPVKILHETAFPNPRALTLIQDLLRAFQIEIQDERALPHYIYVTHDQWLLIPSKEDGTKTYTTGRYEIAILSDFELPCILGRNQAVAVGRIR